MQAVFNPEVLSASTSINHSIESHQNTHFNHHSLLQFLTMKTSILAAVAFSSFALAVPSGKKEWCKNGDYKKGDIEGDYGAWPKKEYFTSMYSIVATPDQVVNNVSVSTPGQPGAVGYYNYAINSKDDVICYVS
jgi:hypothetical protein